MGNVVSKCVRARILFFRVINTRWAGIHPPVILQKLDDRFHETGRYGTSALLVDSSFAVG
jgi:hypothetical protein